MDNEVTNARGYIQVIGIRGVGSPFGGPGEVGK